MTPFSKPQIVPTTDEERRLEQVRAAFLTRLNSMPDRQRQAFIATTAHEVSFTVGDKELEKADAYTVALAKQLKSVADITAKMEAAKAEIAEIDAMDLSGYRPGDPDHRGRALARREDLAKSLEIDHARALAISQEDHSEARREAVLQFRDKAAQAAKAEAILAAASRIKAEAADREIESRAKLLVDGERISAGLKPLPEDD